MNFPLSFIAYSHDFTTKTNDIPAPYLRRRFYLDETPEKADILVCATGFYELYINGRRITRSALAPYISNPDHLLYYDSYDVRPLLTEGENVIGLLLGNGFANNPDGWLWEFDRARFRAAPCAALRLDMGEPNIIETDTQFLTAPSPIIRDDYRGGEHYDARLELSGWAEPGFDDSGWRPAVIAPAPRGETVLNTANPIVVTKELQPVAVTALSDGYLYDFGLNCAGVFRLSIKGHPGQRIDFSCGEHLLADGRLDMRNIVCHPDQISQRDVYICKGAPEGECWTPVFTYHGYQYIFVQGLEAEQAVPETLTYIVMNTELEERGGFSCSDDITNSLQNMVRLSTVSNFHHIPTDCPQREKNGWTADAALSAEHTLLNLSPETNYRQWLQSIRKAMSDAGALPGIVPTGGCGFTWGNGPGWDCVLIYLPYFTYIYRGDKAILEENAHSIMRYLDYLSSRVGADGLIAIGLGDWCPAARGYDKYKAPLALTDSVLSMDICEKAAYIFERLNRPLQADFARGFYNRLRMAVRERLIDLNTMTAAGNCQTSQAMALFYDVFEPGEKSEAFRRLLSIIEQNDGLMDVGVLGGRVLFHVLSDFGYSELAYDMITTTRFPSYGNWVVRGATTLWEEFRPEDSTNAVVESRNHHFWGDISHWFIRQLAGIRYNPYRRGGEADICPAFVPALDYAEAWHKAPEGRIAVRWERNSRGISLDITIPASLKGEIRLPEGFAFEDGMCQKPAVTGVYMIIDFFRKKSNEILG